MKSSANAETTTFTSQDGLITAGVLSYIILLLIFVGLYRRIAKTPTDNINVNPKYINDFRIYFIFFYFLSFIAISLIVEGVNEKINPKEILVEPKEDDTKEKWEEYTFSYSKNLLDSILEIGIILLISSVMFIIICTILHITFRNYKPKDNEIQPYFARGWLIFSCVIFIVSVSIVSSTASIKPEDLYSPKS